MTTREKYRRLRPARRVLLAVTVMAGLVIFGALACQTERGAEASTPVPAAVPTSTPVPAAVPTSTPVPTATPTSTPVPTATPTSTPVPTATPTGTMWEGLRHWYRDRSFEDVLNASLVSRGLRGNAKIAALDSFPPANDFALSLGCLGAIRYVYLSPYQGRPALPETIYYIAFDLWDIVSGDWAEGMDFLVYALHEAYSRASFSPVVTGDGLSVAFEDSAQVRDIRNAMQAAAGEDHWLLVVTIGAAEDDGGESDLVAQFDPAGLDEVLTYLTC